ncbi:MAG: hypothetical protein J5953_13615, partial [Prevotella sp.]|nr:hypothetical protein [Prevotella sp.]
QYFAPDSRRLDCLVERNAAINDFRVNYNMKDITTNMFFRKMRAFVKYCSYTEEFNPDELCAQSKPGHIIKRKTSDDGLSGEPVEWIYVRSNREVLKMILEQNERDQAKLDVVPTEGVLFQKDDEPF